MKILLQLLFLFFSGVLCAQGGLIIGENSYLVTKGSPGIVIKDGRFHNDGAFVASNGALIMYGTAPTEASTIGGSSVTNFHDLIIAKSSHDVRLDYDIAVDGDLEMQGGMMILNYSDIQLEGNIIGETEDSRITGTEGGAIIKTVDLNAPAKVNPGNMGLEITSTENLGLTTIRRSHVARENNGNFSINRHFSLDPQNNNNLDATLRMHYFDGELAGLTESELKLWRFDETEWLSFEPAQSNTSENWIESSDVAFFYDFTLAENLEGPLPIELLQFNATVNDRKQVVLDWVTSSEINNDFFTIERSQDGIGFEPIEDINGAGTSDQAIYYESLDPNPFSGTSYYRLRQTDFDGTQTFSPVRAVNIHMDNQFSVYPNPMRDILNITNDGTYRGKATIQIVDVLGVTRYYQKLEMGDQVNNLLIEEVNTFETGSYYLTIQTAKEIFGFNLVKVDDK